MQQGIQKRQLPPLIDAAAECLTSEEGRITSNLHVSMSDDESDRDVSDIQEIDG